MKLITDWRHWLVGINWGREELTSIQIHIVAIHFGPWCLMWTKEQ